MPLSAICWPCWPYWPCMSQATFRHLLTMLAFFDITFITTAAISLSLPQLSTYWKVHDMSKQWWRFWVTIFLMLDTHINNTNDLVTPKRVGCTRGSSPGWCLSSRCLSLDPSGGRYFYLLSLFNFVWFWCSLWPFLATAFPSKELNRSAIVVDRKLFSVCLWNHCLANCAKYIWLGVIRLALRAILTQVPELFFECFLW